MKKGEKMPEEQRRKISKSNMGRSTWITGVGHSEETKAKIAKSHLGMSHPHSDKTKQKMSAKRRKSDNANWRGGVSSLQHLLRESFKYRQWRSDVFTRDDFTCVIGGASHKNKLNADHIESFSSILEKNKILTTEQGFACEELWNINNGRTLCVDCHRKTDTYGGRKKIYA